MRRLPPVPFPPRLLLLGLSSYLAWGAAAASPAGWSSEFALPGPNERVEALAVYEGVLVAGGEFTRVDGESIPYLAAWDGNAWRPLGAGVDGPVRALAVHEGNLIVGGSFSHAGGLPAGRVARWDGERWHAFGGGFDGVVHALATFRGDLIAGGRFQDAGGIPANRIARWDGSAWTPLGAGVGGVLDYRRPVVRALAVFEDELMAGGEFSAAGDDSARHLARWDGERWRPFGSGIELEIEGDPVECGTPLPGVHSMAVHAGELVIGGDFTRVDGREFGNIARWSGGDWSSIGSFEIGHSPRAFLSHAGGLYAGAWRDCFDGEVSVWRFDGAAWERIGPRLVEFNGGTGILALAVWEGEIFAGGRLLDPPHSTDHLLRGDGDRWHPVTGGRAHGVNGTVECLAEFEGDLVAGGWFSRAGGVPLAHVGRWDGSSWSPLGAGVPGPARALLVHRGELYAGGWFGVQRWDGAAWSPVGGGLAGIHRGIHALMEHEGRLIAAGRFDAIGGVEAASIAAWDGSSWTPLGTGIDGGLYPRVNALAVYRGLLVAGGSFSAAGGERAINLAGWTGEGWRSLGSFANRAVAALVVHGEHLYAGGWFDAPYRGIVRWDGRRWEGVGNASGSVSALRSDGRFLYAGGSFSRIGGVDADGVARFWNGRWSPLGEGIAGPVHALALRGEDLYAGGPFARAGRRDSQRIARWLPPPPSPPVEVSALAAGAVDGAIEIRWSATASPELFGFHLHRSEEHGPFTRITGTPIPPSDEGEYAWADDGVELGRVYAYGLAVLYRDRDEEEWGPVTARALDRPGSRVLLHAIQPNPFGGETVIRYSLPREEIVRLRVFDIQGRRVATLVDGPVPAGAYWLPWDGRGIDGRRLAEGVYIVRLQWRGGSVARKVEVIR